MRSVLHELQIYGLPESTENAILASLMQGDPALLIGGPGTAKTELLEMIGSALREYSKQELGNRKKKDWFTYQVYDTSKLNPEDLIGFPDPSALKEGRMDFIRSPGTVWDKGMVVWDEINRCDKSRQSNLFEIIRSRRLSGMPTNNQFLYGAMNPLGDAGTQEMSDALVDRFMYYIWFAPFHKMDQDSREAIINRVGTHESVGLRYWTKSGFDLDTSDDTVNERLAAVGKMVHDIMTNAAKIYDNLKQELGVKTARLINRLTDRIADDQVKSSSKHSFEISGRRASMMMRGLLSMRAIQLAKAELMNTEIPPLEQCVNNAAVMLVPIGVGQKISAGEMTRLRELISEDISTNFKVIFANDQNADTVYSIYNDKHPLSRMKKLLSIKNIPNITAHRLWTELKESTQESSEIEMMFYLIKQSYPSLIPEHVEIQQDQIFAELSKQNDKSGKQVTSQSVTPPYSKHKALIDSTYASLNGTTESLLLRTCYAKSLAYLCRFHKDVSAKDAVDNLNKLNELIEAIKERIKELKI